MWNLGFFEISTSTMRVDGNFLWQNLLEAGIALPEFNIQVRAFLLYGSVSGGYSLLRTGLGKICCLPVFKNKYTSQLFP